MSNIHTNTINQNRNNAANWQAEQARMLQNNRDPNARNIGGAMDKHQFLQMLVMQLRHQDPLAPTENADFSAQLAQFSALEQMQNMNTTLSGMALQHSFALVGQFVYAEVRIDGEMVSVSGFVDQVFTENGIIFAEVNGVFVPVTSISAVLDGAVLPTERDLFDASRTLIGKKVVAIGSGNTEFEGVVERVAFSRLSNGTLILVAFIRDEDGDIHEVPVRSIVDIRDENAPRENPPAPEPPPSGGGGSND